MLSSCDRPEVPDKNGETPQKGHSTLAFHTLHKKQSHTDPQKPECFQRRGDPHNEWFFGQSPPDDVAPCVLHPSGLLTMMHITGSLFVRSNIF